MAHQVSYASQDQYHNQMVIPLQEAITTHSLITTHAFSFTLDQYQQLLALTSLVLSSIQ